MCKDLLKLSLEQKTPVLLLGAGFSYGATNSSGDKLPLGNNLAHQIYEEMFKENPPCPEIFNDDNDAAHKFAEDGNLKKLCDLIRAEGRVDERNAFLTSVFSGATFSDDSCLQNISKYKWDKIFTLNIDCALESIFDSKKIPYNVWHRKDDDRRNKKNKTTIIKLHGCVRNSSEGYVFDNEEYISFLNEEDCFIRDFADAYSKNDMIFLGTEFQEEDLNSIINKYEQKGYDTSGNNYFFISPKINDPILRRKIEQSKNYYCVEWSSKEFCEFLDKEVALKKDIRKVLTEKGMKFIDDFYADSTEGYESKLYTGCESLYDDFIYNWDIIHSKVESFEKSIIHRKDSFIVAVIGKSYIGKSCTAKRILFDLRKLGFLSFEFSMKSSEQMALFVDYLKQLTDNTRVALLFEEASYYYLSLYDNIIKKCPSNISQLIIVTSDTENNHYARKDILKSNNCLELLRLDEKINREFAEKIYLKLKEKHWLNKPTLTGSTEEDIIKYACRINDIIEFLYNITYGIGFERHFKDKVLVVEDDTNFKCLQAITMLGVLGMSSLPDRILPALVKNDRTQFDIKKFKKDYEEILTVENHRIKVRCLRLIHSLIVPNISEDERIYILLKIVSQVQRQFNEGDINEYSEIFQKALTVKRILKEKILSLSSVKKFLNQAERYGNPYSFYWIQRGISASKNREFDLADNYFREGINIRPRSYQAHHALAKNLMERALSQLENGDHSYAPKYMDEGVNKVKSIIEDPAFSRGYKYSLHTLIDMSMKYYTVYGKLMDENLAQYILDKILELPKREVVDICMGDIVKKFCQYCEDNGMNTYSDLIAEAYKEEQCLQEIEEEEYLIENLDWEN